MLAVFSVVFNDNIENRQRISKPLVLFFHSMYKPIEILSKKKKNSVKFEDESSEQESLDSNTLCTVNMVLDKNSHLFKYTIKFLNHLCLKIEKECDISYLKLLNVIISSVQSLALFEEINAQLQIITNNNDSIIDFFEYLILKWLPNLDNDIAIAHTIDIIFNICIVATNESALKLLNEVTKVNNAIFLKEVLNRSLTIYKDNNIFQEWLKSSLLSQTIILGIEKTLESILHSGRNNHLAVKELDAYQTMLTYSLNSSNSQGSLLKAADIKTILTNLKSFIEASLNKIKQNPSCQDLLANVYDLTLILIKYNEKNWNYGIMDELLALYFHISLKSQDFQISVQLKSKLMDIWLAGVKTCVQFVKEFKENHFLEKIANELHDLIFNFKSNDEILQILEHSSKLLSTYNDALISLGNDSDFHLITMLLEKILPSKKEWMNLQDGFQLNILPSFLERKIFYPLPEGVDIPSQPKQMPQHVLVSELISSLFLHKISILSSQENQESCIIKHLPYLLWSFNYCEGYGYLKNEGSEEYEIACKLQKNCFKILSFLSYEDVDFLIRKAFYLSLEKGFEGALPLQTIIEFAKTIHPKVVDNFPELITEAHECDNDEKYITVQVLIHHLSKENKVQYLKDLMEILSAQLDIPVAEFRIIDLYGNLAEMCCYIQENGIIDLEEIQENIKPIIINCINCTLSHQSNQYILLMESIFSTLVKHTSLLVNERNWDFICKILLSSIKKGKDIPLLKSRDLIILHQTISLVSMMSLLLDEDCQQHPEMKSVWNLDFTKEINEEFLFLFLHLADMCINFKPLPKTLESLLSCMCETIEFLSGQHILDSLTPYIVKKKLPPKLKENKIASINCLVELFIPNLTSSIRPLQFTSHLIINKIMPLLPIILENDSKCESEDEKEEIPIKLTKLIDMLKYTNQIIESMLLDIRIGDCCTVLPYTDSYVYSMAYLFIWIEILELISTSSAQFRSGYIIYLEEQKLLTPLLSNVFRLMPENPLINFEKKCGDLSPKEKMKVIFKNPPILSSLEPPSSKELQSLACYVFCTGLKKVPAIVRTWWTNLDKEPAEIVNRFTSKFISGMLSSEEIQAVHENENEFEGITVRARPSTREVIAIYYIDEVAIELCVQLPTNYPLGPIMAEQKGKSVVAQQEWRHWLMQLKAVLTYQNGSILDGLMIWKKNLDKKFEGVEECMICYYILHNNTWKLPKLSCHICRKKFHSSCLFKWFQKSNNSTCPLCRNDFY